MTLPSITFSAPCFDPDLNFTDTVNVRIAFDPVSSPVFGGNTARRELTLPHPPHSHGSWNPHSMANVRRAIDELRSREDGSVVKRSGSAWPGFALAAVVVATCAVGGPATMPVCLLKRIQSATRSAEC